MDSVMARCGDCGHQWSVKDDRSGREIPCPVCGAPVRVVADNGQEPAIRIEKSDLRATTSEAKQKGGGWLPARSTLKANRRIAGKVCSICQDSIQFGEAVQICGECDLPFHAECWAENGGCGTYGCSASPDDMSGPSEGSSQQQSTGRPAASAPGETETADGSSTSAGTPQAGSRTSGLAIASFVLGLLGLCGIGSLLAVIFGHCALSEIDKSGGAVTGRGLAVAGLVLGYVFGAITAIWLVAAFSGSL